MNIGKYAEMYSEDLRLKNYQYGLINKKTFLYEGLFYCVLFFIFILLVQIFLYIFAKEQTYLFFFNLKKQNQRYKTLYNIILFNQIIYDYTSFHV